MPSVFKVTVIQHWLHDAWFGPDGNPCAEGTPGARFVKKRKVPAGTPGARKGKKKAGKGDGRRAKKTGRGRVWPAGGGCFPAKGGGGVGGGANFPFQPAGTPTRVEGGGTGGARRYARSALESLLDRSCQGVSVETTNQYLTAL